MKASFIGACPEMTGDLIHFITDRWGVSEQTRARPTRGITYKTFAKYADLGPLREEDHPAMYRISSPENWAISFHSAELPSGAPLWYFDWSRMEHLFVTDPDAFDLRREDRIARRRLAVEERVRDARRIR
jgi:hypothetical protein